MKKHIPERHIDCVCMLDIRTRVDSNYWKCIKTPQHSVLTSMKIVASSANSSERDLGRTTFMFQLNVVCKFTLSGFSGCYTYTCHLYINSALKQHGLLGNIGNKCLTWTVGLMCALKLAVCSSLGRATKLRLHWLTGCCFISGSFMCCLIT